MKRSISRVLAAIMLLGTLNIMPAPVLAEESTDGDTAQTAMYAVDYEQKVNAFINDPRWSHGTPWGFIGPQSGSDYSATGCCAYAVDFAWFVFGHRGMRSADAFTDGAEVRPGDIIHGYFSGGEHWFVVLDREGDRLYTAEGNYYYYDSGYSGVYIGWDAYEVNGSSVVTYGSHMPGFVASDSYHHTAPLIIDEEAPVIKDAKVTDIGEGGYTISCRVTDNDKLAKVEFSACPGENEELAQWLEGTCDDEIFTFRVSVNDFGRLSGTYSSRIRAVDKSGNKAELELPPVNVPEADMPLITDARIEEVGDGYYTVACEVTDSTGVARVQFVTSVVPSQNESDEAAPVQEVPLLAEVPTRGQPVDENTYVFTVYFGDYGYQEGTYITEITAFDWAGNVSEKSTVSLDGIFSMDAGNADETGGIMGVLQKILGGR